MNKALPKTKTRREKVLKKIISKYTQGVENSADNSELEACDPCLKEVIHEMPKKGEARRKTMTIIADYVAKKKAAKYYGLRYNTLRRLVQNKMRKTQTSGCKKRKNAISDAEKARITRFYARPDISTELPGKKHVSKRTGQQSHILQRTLRETLVG